MIHNSHVFIYGGGVKLLDYFFFIYKSQMINSEYYAKKLTRLVYYLMMIHSSNIDNVINKKLI